MVGWMRPTTLAGPILHHHQNIPFMTSIKISEAPLQVSDASHFLADARCGGEAYFVGNVRNKNLGHDILYLAFSSYQPMAEREMQRLATEILAATGATKLYAAHRIGRLEVGETAVVIGAAAVHRDAAFQACRQMIDRLKESVPIWKKEVTTQGDFWINAHP